MSEPSIIALINAAFSEYGLIGDRPASVALRDKALSMERELAEAKARIAALELRIKLIDDALEQEHKEQS